MLKAAAGEDGEELPREAIKELAMEMTLRIASPLIAEIWFMETVLDPADAPLPQLFNSDGDGIEFIKVSYRFTGREGTFCLGSTLSNHHRC